MSAERYGAYSVLMSVYSKENPAWLKLAIESIQDQTLPTSDFVLVCDGPLTPELDGVIAEKHCQMGEILMVVRLEKNVGLGNALNEGIKHCRNELVARMDSDDIAYPDRCEKQVAIFNKYPIVSICSGTVMEFSKNPETINCKRVLPEKNKEIIEFAKKRNPFNHPCVMYKKSAVEAVGSYQHFYLLEDYYLWIRMLMAGYEGYNIQEPLLYMRAGTSMYKRRAGWRYAKTQIELFRFMWKQGFINAWQYDLLPATFYNFDADGKMTDAPIPTPDPDPNPNPDPGVKNGIVNEDGELYYYVNGVKTYAGLIKIDGDYYYVNSSCKVVTNCRYWISKTNDLLPATFYNFDADGKMTDAPIPTPDPDPNPNPDPEVKNGIVSEDGELYYYVNGVKTYAGLIQIDGDYYYVNSSCKIVTNQRYWISKTNDLLPATFYTFGADGKMVK